MKIYFKYSNDNWVTETAENFDCNIFIPNIQRNKVVAETLNGTIVVHKKHERKQMRAVISANELFQSATRTFLDAFLSAKSMRYSEDNITFIDAEVPEDESIDYINGNKSLPKYEFVIVNKFKD